MNSNNNENGLRLPALLSQYVSVWIWSIQFGALTGVTYSYISFNLRDNWGLYTLILVLFTVVGIVISLQAWFFNYKYLIIYLIPKFILQRDISEKEINHAAFLLKRAFFFLIMAIMLRLFLIIFERILTVL